jgi:hypothetical protein
MSPHKWSEETGTRTEARLLMMHDADAGDRMLNNMNRNQVLPTQKRLQSLPSLGLLLRRH